MKRLLLVIILLSAGCAPSIHYPVLCMGRAYLSAVIVNENLVAEDPDCELCKIAVGPTASGVLHAETYCPELDMWCGLQGNTVVCEPGMAKFVRILYWQKVKLPGVSMYYDNQEIQRTKAAD